MAVFKVKSSSWFRYEFGDININNLDLEEGSNFFSCTVIMMLNLTGS